MDEFDEELPPVSRSTGTPAALLVLLFAAILCGVLLYLRRDAEESDSTGAAEALAKSGPNHPAVGNPVAPFYFPPLVNASGPIQPSDLKGKVALVNFWGPWCGYCRVEFPHLVKLRDKFRSRDEFLFVSVSYPNSADESAADLAAESDTFLKQGSFKLPVYHDPGGRSVNALARASAASGLGFPTTVLLDREGKIRGLWVGFVPEFSVQMERTVEKVLGEK